MSSSGWLGSVWGKTVGMARGGGEKKDAFVS